MDANGHELISGYPACPTLTRPVGPDNSATKPPRPICPPSLSAAGPAPPPRAEGDAPALKSTASPSERGGGAGQAADRDRKSKRLNFSHVSISYVAFRLLKINNNIL